MPERPVAPSSMSNWKTLALAIVITALITGTGGYLLGRTTSQGTQGASFQPSPKIEQSAVSAPSPRSTQQEREAQRPPVPTRKWDSYPECKDALYTDLNLALKDSESVCGLDLEGNNLFDVPPDIYRLRDLKVLLLGSNKLTRVPAEIIFLKKLTALTFDHNQLAKVPSWVGELDSLHSLSLGFNKLTTLPPEIGKLSNLRLLDLTGNPMTEDEVEKISRLLPETNVVFLRPMSRP
jgi:Leucine-rich repeat (LRR) protein